MTHWSTFGVRSDPAMSGRTKHEPISFLKPFADERFAKRNDAFRGVTVDGTVRPDLFELRSTGRTLAAVADAALEFLSALDEAQRTVAEQPMDSDDWRTWINVHMNYYRHGVLLEDVSSEARQRALDVLRASMSARGFAQARDIMRLNQLLGDVKDSHDEFNEWLYFMTIFGDPAGDGPWGWQIDGHHLCINCVIVGDQIVMTPAFMGSEPRSAHSGRFAGTQLFTAEESSGLRLIQALDGSQAGRAITRSSILPDDLPRELQHPFDGRMQAGAFQDNAVLPDEGIVGADLTDGQRALLLDVVASYAGWVRHDHAEFRMEEVAAHLDETWFSWMGATDDIGPFYYRVHSPVVLIEFDHHPGVVFDNKVPTRNHIHTVVRTPNGGDYGADLLRQHHERFDHRHGEHRPHD
jgi:hypothetical protein